MFFYDFSWRFGGYFAQLNYFASVLLAVGFQTRLPLLLLPGPRHPGSYTCFLSLQKNPCMGPSGAPFSTRFPMKQCPSSFIFLFFFFFWKPVSKILCISLLTILCTFSFRPYNHSLNWCFALTLRWQSRLRKVVICPGPVVTRGAVLGTWALYPDSHAFSTLSCLPCLTDVQGRGRRILP